MCLFPQQVPQYYTDLERRGVLHAADIAGLNCLKVISDTTAGNVSCELVYCKGPSPIPR